MNSIALSELIAFLYFNPLTIKKKKKILTPFILTEHSKIIFYFFIFYFFYFQFFFFILEIKDTKSLTLKGRQKVGYAVNIEVRDHFLLSHAVTFLITFHVP